MATKQPTIIYTLTDEAPMLATWAVPADHPHLHRAGGRRTSHTSDISVAARILAEFPEYLSDAQKVPDNLAELGTPDAAARHQHHQAAQHQCLGAPVDRGDQGAAGARLQDPRLSRRTRKTDEEKAIRARYAKVLGSAVNPVLREGNSDRRAPLAVKRYARKHPHSMGEWSQASRTHVAHDEGRRLLSRREVDDARQGARRPHGARHARAARPWC